MSREIDLLMEAVGRADSRIDKLSDGMAEVAGHCATLIERTEHLATREDLSTAIRTHSAECSAGRRLSKNPNGKKLSDSTVRLIKAVAVFLTAIAAAIGAYVGFGGAVPQ